MILRRPLTVELTDLIARLGELIAMEDRLTHDEMYEFREWMKAARALHHREIREARFGKRGVIVRLLDFERAERVMSGDATPCDVRTGE